MYRESKLVKGEVAVDTPMKRYIATFKSKNPTNTWLISTWAAGFYETFKYENRHAISAPSGSPRSTEFCAGVFFREQEDGYLSVVYIDTNIAKDQVLVDKFLSELYDSIVKELTS